MDLLHLRIMWAPGGPNIMSPLSRFLVTSNDIAETGTTFETQSMPTRKQPYIHIHTLKCHIYLLSFVTC